MIVLMQFEFGAGEPVVYLPVAGILPEGSAKGICRSLVASLLEIGAGLDKW
jgi:hypothetical protein